MLLRSGSARDDPHIIIAKKTAADTNDTTPSPLHCQPIGVEKVRTLFSVPFTQLSALRFPFFIVGCGNDGWIGGDVLALCGLFQLVIVNSAAHTL